MFDLDDTLVHTDCCIRTSAGRLTTRDYARLRGTVDLSDDAFVEFSDPSCDFSLGPYFGSFVAAIREGSPIAVITARAMRADDMRKLLDRVASRGDCSLQGAKLQVYCCNEADFPGEGETLEERKAWAVRNFVQQHPCAVSAGFSDDDATNLSSVASVFNDLQASRPEVKFRVYAA